MNGISLVSGNSPSELAEKLDQFGVATVDIADDVERAGELAAIGPQRLPHHDGVVDLVARVQLVDPFEAFAPEASPRSAKGLGLVADHVRPELPVGPAGVTLPAHLGRDVQHDGYRVHMMASSQLNQWFAILGPNTGGVDHHEAASLESFGRDVVQHLEGWSGS